jgi:hypothetical protein
MGRGFCIVTLESGQLTDIPSSANLIISSASFRPSSSLFRNPIILKAPCTHPDWRIESCFPLIAILSRFIVVLKSPPSSP